jgi:hypothetical protein
MVQPPTPGWGEVHRGPPRGHLAPPWPGPGCAHPAQVRRSLALRRLINTRGGPPRGGQGRAGLRDQLFARLIQAHLRSLGGMSPGEPIIETWSSSHGRGTSQHIQLAFLSLEDAFVLMGVESWFLAAVIGA